MTQAALLALLIVAVAAPAQAVTCASSPFFVTSIGDGGDAAPNDGTCADAVGACTLRAAIEEMNAGGCSATINFNIAGCGGVCTLAPATALPAVTQPVTIDGYTQPGASPNTLANGSDAVLLIEIDGTSVAPGSGGLSITGGSSTVRGLVVNRFAALAGSPPVNGFGINVTGGGGNTIMGNFVGTDPTGAVVRPNERGIGVLSGNNLIGGPAPDARNVVSGSGTGIQINGAAAVSNVVQNNYVGVGPDGITVLGNPGPNSAGFAGINIGGGATTNTVGGTTAAAANVVAANSPNNIRIRGSATQHNVIEGNYIGTNAAGSSLGGGGVLVENSASNNRIGGQAGGAGNTIAYNTTAGVTLVSGTGNAVLSNSIFANASVGIDIGNNGVGPANDACDPDGGPNLTQNFPMITSVSGSGGNTTIAGTLDSAAGTTFTVEFFDNVSCDASGYGEGATLIGSATVSTGALCGAVSFGGTFPYTLAAGHVVTATATDPSGNTSEFSACAGMGMCGNGIVDPGEHCDDGNPTSGDCCSAACQYEVGSCNDGNLCTQTDTCQSGVCTGSAVICTALDQCHDAGTCDPGTGCSNPPKAPGAPCGSSSSGVCDNADSCDGEGVCLANHVTDGTTCDDGSVCTEQDGCVAGTCTGTALPQGTACTDDGIMCTEDVCDAVGMCQHDSPTGTYTLDADFDQGTLFNVNHNVADQLQLSWPTAPFPFVNVAASNRGTIVRIDVNGGQILGEYLTAPDSMGRNPSRTTVDQHGNVWVANRNEGGFSGGQNKGSASRVGLLVGGTRTDAAGTPDANGQYVKPPFQYNTCVDRDGDGLLKTSSGLGNILPWTNAGSVDSDGGVSTAEDECIINYTRVTGTATRTIAVDANNDVWIGGYGDFDHEKISGITGLPVPGTQFNLYCGGYGGLVDHNGVLWSAREGNGLLRYDTTTLTGACLGTSMGDYGLGIDPQTGEIWQSSYYQGRVWKISPAGTSLGDFASPTSRGVAVDGSNNVWVVNSDVPSVRHLRTDGTLVGDVILPGASFSTGVAVDTNGKVWVTNNNDNVMRIDPSAGSTGGGGFPIGAVDMTVSLGLYAGPYNYSDMTGFVAIGSTSQQGTWIVTRDSGVTGNPWGAVTWNTEQQGSEPAGTSIGVEVRAADTVTGLASQLFTAVTNGGASGVSGQFIEIRATLRSTAINLTPVLSDLRVEVGCGPTTCSTEADCDDADACTLDACSPAESGANSFGCVYTGVACTALDACHDAGTCNPVTGQCSNPAKPDGASCQDQDLCTGDEVCQGGTCTGGYLVDCDDGNPCSVDGCDSVSGCTHVPGDAGVVCRPAVDECDVAETCTGLSTVCPGDNHNPACCGPKVFIVTSTADSSDASIGDAVCADAGGNCTLRAAIEEANVDICADTINFNIPGCGGVCTLTPATPLPAVTQPVTIDGYTQPGASSNTLANGSDAVLLIEIDGTGVAAGNSGLSITGGSSTVRGLVINRFASLAGTPPVNGFGVSITGGGGNAITGNFLGTDPTGASARPNERGIGVFSGSNTIGGPAPDARNVVSGNGTGIHINSLTAVSNVVQNNYVGVGPDGNTALGNTGFAGINIAGGATSNTVGGTTAAAANVIAATGQNNIRIRGSATQHNVIEGNYIGTNAAGTSLGGGGVLVETSASNNRIGGQAAGAGNTIAYNSTAGVVLLNGTGNAILSNSIFGNTLGIDLGNNGAGPANDACDPDSGPNLTQNFPVITSVSSSGGNTTIAGTLDSAVSATFILEFFDNTSCDASGYGQGATWIGSTTVGTGAVCGAVSFGGTFAYALAAGHVVTATATDPGGNTSEFSACAGMPCGDGAVDPGEQCDDGNVADGDCCSSACLYEATGSSCGDPDATACDAPDTCDGSGGCVDRKKDSGTVCLAGTGTCDPDDTCDGTSNACVAVYAGSGASCDDPDGTACNAPDTCNGSGSCVDRKKDSGTVCLAGTGTCDPDDTCDGATSICAPVYAGGGTGCDLDANACTNDQCNGSGSCAFASNRDCDDGDLCTQDACDPSSGCQNAVTPATACNATAGKASLKIAHDAANDAKDRVQFKWSKGTAEMSEFGNPTTTTDYTLCVYDADGSVVGLSVEGGADCGGTPCWILSGSTGEETGIQYKDSSKPAANDGIAAIKGKSSTTGKATLQVKAQGIHVATIDLGTGLTSPVTAQVVTSDAACFEATFAPGDEKTNDDTQFKAMRSVP